MHLKTSSNFVVFLKARNVKSQNFLAAYRPGEFLHPTGRSQDNRESAPSSFSNAFSRHCRSVSCSAERTSDISKYAAHNEFFQELSIQIRAVANIADSAWNPW